MGHAFTPGLKIRNRERVIRERILPLRGDVLCDVGDSVHSEQVVARTELPGEVEILKAAHRLAIEPDELPSVMLKRVGDPVKKREVIARTKGLFGLFRTELESPMDGTIESISEITGQIVIRGVPQPVELHAYMDGFVSEVIPGEGLVVESIATLIQGIFGVGGENWGILKTVGAPDIPLEASHISSVDANGAILVGGSLMTYEAIRSAIEMGAKGLISGGVSDDDLRKVLGYDIGVAITGSEKIPLALIVTEGFGELPIARRTWELMEQRAGERASVNGATQIRAGVLRPEIIIPFPGESSFHFAESESAQDSGILEIGTLVRIIREPHFGRIGRVTELPVELTPIETESRVRVLKVQLDNGTSFYLPRANVEIYEG